MNKPSKTMARNGPQHGRRREDKRTPEHHHSYDPARDGDPPVDTFLGTIDHQRVVKALSSDFLRPAIKLQKRKIGAFRRVHIHYVVPDFYFFRRLDILRLLPEGPVRYYLAALRTRYFNYYVRRFGSIRPALWRIWRYRKLFKSIRRHGLRVDQNDPRSVPWLFASKESIYRLDGHHRASIARLLGYESLEVLLFTPKDLKELDDLPAPLREAAAQLHEPEADLSRDPYELGRETAAPPR